MVTKSNKCKLSSITHLCVSLFWSYWDYLNISMKVCQNLTFCKKFLFWKTVISSNTCRHGLISHVLTLQNTKLTDVGLSPTGSLSVTPVWPWSFFGSDKPGTGSSTSWTARPESHRSQGSWNGGWCRRPGRRCNESPDLSGGRGKWEQPEGKEPQRQACTAAAETKEKS